jgi:dTDP-4-amino-4,6-dideoxygalactose transaminase
MGMFNKMGLSKETLVCLSFHIKKHIPIGKGGMILCDDYGKYKLLRELCYDGRSGLPYNEERVTEWGYHMYMTPEQAARGLLLLETIPEPMPDDIQENYPDLRNHPIFLKGQHYD